MIARSLRWRLLLGAVAAILAALVVAWMLMAWLFERHLERRLQTEMTRDALQLVAAVTRTPHGTPVVAAGPADPRLQQPAGGYYWQVTASGASVGSRSLWDAALDLPGNAPSTDWRLRHAAGPYQQRVVLLERSLVVDTDLPPMLVQLAQDVHPLATARAEFARELGAFLLLLWLVLSAAAWVQVALGLRPLRTIRSDLAALRNSARARLPASRIREIQPLADAINALADARERDLKQARGRAADLAHGLKTPLAALSAQSRRARLAGAADAADGMDRAIAAMDSTIYAELARARVAAAGSMPGAVADVRAAIERLVDVLEHTERGGQLAFDIDVPASLQLAINPENFSEIMGAVLENAVVYARRRVRVVGSAGPEWTRLVVEDDGPGIAGDQLREALVRGRRLDEYGSGSGLGLAIARELVDASGGRISLGEAALGGLAVVFLWGTGAGAAVGRD